jgi:hypothetical protein
MRAIRANTAIASGLIVVEPLSDGRAVRRH